VGLVWQRIASGSGTSRAKLARRFGGQPLRYVDHDCASGPERQGRNTMWSSCTVRVIPSSGDAIRLRLFGSIIERDEKYKIVGF
jgi:hypothetical protein